MSKKQVEVLRAHVIKWWEDLDFRYPQGRGSLGITERAHLLRPFDDVLELKAFCRLPCNSRDTETNLCSRKQNGAPCEFHHSYG